MRTTQRKTDRGSQICSTIVYCKIRARFIGMASKMYFTLQFTSYLSLAILSLCILYLFILKISEAAFSYYMRPHVQSNVAASNNEDLGRQTVIVRQERRLKKRDKTDFRS